MPSTKSGSKGFLRRRGTGVGIRTDRLSFIYVHNYTLNVFSMKKIFSLCISFFSCLSKKKMSAHIEESLDFSSFLCNEEKERMKKWNKFVIYSCNIQHTRGVMIWSLALSYCHVCVGLVSGCADRMRQMDVVCWQPALLFNVHDMARKNNNNMNPETKEFFYFLFISISSFARHPATTTKYSIFFFCFCSRFYVFV